MSAVTGLSKAVDCHAHVFVPNAVPSVLEDGYRYSPIELGTVEQYRAVLSVHGFSHGILVNPYGAYGTDNEHMLACLRAAPGSFKGIAAVALDAPDSELARLVDGGVVGIRFSLQYGTTPSLATSGAERILARAREIGWFVQIVGPGEQVAAVLPVLRKARVRGLIDHCGRPDPRKGVAYPSFSELLRFGRETDSLVKLSAPWRFSHEAWPYSDAAPFVQALVDAFTLDRCIWGSDWPFSRTGMRVDYGPVLDCLARFLPSADDRRRVLWDTPARAFGLA